MQSIDFPSFAPSPTHSPHNHSPTAVSSPPLRRIAIELPDSLLESTNTVEPTIEQSLAESNAKKETNIQIYCRFRPCLQSMSAILHDHTMVQDGDSRFSFDGVFGVYSSQQEVFARVAGRHIESFFQGRNSTLFAYGQTGSGKTHTMFGDLRGRKEGGLIPRTLEAVFERCEPEEVITCSVVEIYNERLIDLFDPLGQGEGVKLKEIGGEVVLDGLVQARVESEKEIMELVRFGYRDRKTATTLNNDTSSRSHTVLFLYRMHKDRKVKLCFIDLAGSQKIRKSGVKGTTLQQTKKINLSLSCLGNVVSALTTGADHVPYRNSKLTRILKDSLTSTSCTSIITTCSMQKMDHNETVSTIKFAVRAKKIRNKKRLSNVDFTPQEIIESLRKELAQTKKELEYYRRKEEEEQSEEEQGLGEIPEEGVVGERVKVSECAGVSSRVRKVLGELHPNLPAQL